MIGQFNESARTTKEEGNSIIQLNRNTCNNIYVISICMEAFHFISSCVAILKYILGYKITNFFYNNSKINE